MKRTLFVILALILFQAACKKEEDDKQYNLIKITSGTFDGHTFQFNPNQGYLGVVNENTNSYRLVFGSLEQAPELTPGIMDIFFYHSGSSNITFPSEDGQMMNFRLSIEGQDCSFYASNVELIIHEISDNHMRGSLSGEFTNSCENNVPAGVAMDFSIDIEPF